VLLEFEDDDLRRLAYEATYYTRRWSADVTKAYRRVIQVIHDAPDERDLYEMKGLRLEQLKGQRKGSSSVRINSQYRLILRFKTRPDGRVAIIIEAVDYH
jgi:toxin HigB-1